MRITDTVLQRLQSASRSLGIVEDVAAHAAPGASQLKSMRDHSLAAADALAPLVGTGSANRSQDLRASIESINAGVEHLGRGLEKWWTASGARLHAAPSVEIHEAAGRFGSAKVIVDRVIARGTWTASHG